MTQRPKKIPIGYRIEASIKKRGYIGIIAVLLVAILVMGYHVAISNHLPNFFIFNSLENHNTKQGEWKNVHGYK